MRPLSPWRRRASLSAAVAVVAFAAACGGDTSTSGGTTTPPVVTAPAGLSYSTVAASYTLGTAIATNTPSSSGGAATSYSVQPALPAGLTLSTTTGVISGTPTAVAPIAI